MNQITLKDARLNVGKSLEEAATFAGVHPKHLERIEEGEATVYLHVQALLCKLYGISIEHVTTKQHAANYSKEVQGMSEQRKFSRKAVWLAMDSEHGDRLQEIAVERIRLTREVSNFQSMGRRRVEDILVRIHELDAERDELIQPFQQQLDNEALQENTKPTVDLKKVIDHLQEAGYDMSGAYAIINPLLNSKKTTTATTFGEEAEVI